MFQKILRIFKDRLMRQKIISKFFTESKLFGTIKWGSNVENTIEETIKIA